MPEYFINKGIVLSSGYSLYEFLKRPEIKIQDLVNANLLGNEYTFEELEQVHQLYADLAACPLIKTAL